MAKWKEMIPLQVKAPLTVLLRETGKLPWDMVWCHVRRAWAESAQCPEQVKCRISQDVQKTTYAYLSKRYGEAARALVSAPQPGERPEEFVLWVFWWQGERQAPEIVKGCIAAMRRHGRPFRVQVVDSSNYKDFAPVSAHMDELVCSRKISLTHFSDYYRMALLENHGGLWIDASIFLNQTLREDILDGPLFSLRNPGMDLSNISGWNWTVGVIGGWKGNTLFSACRQLLEMYWQDHSFPVDYFIFDFFIKLVYESCPMVRQQIEAVEPNNRGFYELQRCADLPWDEGHAFGDDTWMYKLSWKGNYQLKTPDGRETVYARWLREHAADGKTERES